MLSKRSKVYQTSISMSTGGPQNNFGNFPKNQFNLANPSLIPQPMISQSRRRCDSEVYVKSNTDNPTSGFSLYDGQQKLQHQPQPRPRPTRLPKMGVTSVTRTSTPKSELPSPKSPKYRIPELSSPKTPNFRTSFDFANDNEEPIYCEIVTPGKSPKKIVNSAADSKSSNLVRNSYTRQLSSLANNNEPNPKSPNSVRMNYRRQNSISNNLTDAVVRSPNTVRNGFVRQQVSSESNFIPNIYGKHEVQDSPRVSNNYVRNSYGLAKQKSSLNSDSVESSKNNSNIITNGSQNIPRLQQQQQSNWSQRYRTPDSSNRSGINMNNNNKTSEPVLSPSKQQLQSEQTCQVQNSVKKFEVAGSNPVEIPKKPERIGPVSQSSWSQRYRVIESPVRSLFGESGQDPSPIFRAPVVPKMSQSLYGLGRRAHTQLEISNSKWRIEPEDNQARCSENPSGVDGVVPPFERHRWERHSVNSEATSCSLASYGTHGEDGIIIEARATLLKGVMWLQREKVFSRWKERFFVLTKDYLQCFKKSTSLITEMGGFVFRVRLCEVDELELIVRRGYLTISLATPKTGKLLIRKPDGIRRWYQVIQECVTSCKERQEADREKNRFWMRKQLTDSSSMEQWIESRKQRIDPNYANWTETGSCVSDNATATLLSNNQLGSRKSLETTDYGFIDGPVRRLLSYQRGTSNRELKSIDERRPSSSCQSPNSALLVRKAMSNKSQVEAASSISTTFSRDSGIDSMNAANSPGSIMSNNSSQVTATSNSITSNNVTLNNVTPHSVTPIRALTESPSDLASTSFSYCDQFSRKITLV